VTIKGSVDFSSGV